MGQENGTIPNQITPYVGHLKQFPSSSCPLAENRRFYETNSFNTETFPIFEFLTILIVKPKSINMPCICSQFATINRQLNIFVKSFSCSNNFSNIFAIISSNVTMLVPFLLLSSITDVFILGIVDLVNVRIKKNKTKDRT